jgi:hypothetical protein
LCMERVVKIRKQNTVKFSLFRKTKNSLEIFYVSDLGL